MQANICNVPRQYLQSKDQVSMLSVDIYRHTLCTKQLRDMIRIQIVHKTTYMVNGHHHHCGHHHHLSIITGWPLGGSRYLHRCESLAGLPH